MWHFWSRLGRTSNIPWYHLNCDIVDMRQFVGGHRTAAGTAGGAAISLLYLFDTAGQTDKAKQKQYPQAHCQGSFSALIHESKGHSSL